MEYISVIVPVYKVEPYIRRCVDSILSQTYTDFELILVDDGSPDNCGNICDSYAEQDKRVHVIHQTNGGLSAARNTGIDWTFSNSNSQWIMFVDSDDWIHPECIELLLTAANDSGCQISISDFERMTDYSLPVITEEARIAKKKNAEEFWCQCNGGATIACGKLFKRELFRHIRFPIGKLHEDEYVTYRLLFSDPYVAVLEAPLYCYFYNENSITKSRWTTRRLDKFYALEEQAAFFRKNHFETAFQYRLRSYSYNIADALDAMSEHSDSSDEEKVILQKSARRMLRHYWKSFRISRDRKVYEAAFPALFSLVHYAGRLFRRR